MNYAQLSVPEPGSWTRVAEGILWVRMALPFALDHINLYLLEDNDGWFILDCGLSTQSTRDNWQQILAQLSKPVTGVIATHMHPDHIGLAGWLTERYQIPLYMTQTEYFAARALLGGRAGASPWRDRQYFARCGMDDAAVDKAVGNGDGFAKIVSPMPLAYERLEHGQVLKINGCRWEVMIGRGHSPEHACLYCQERHVLLAGDHVLPSITPNIGVYSTEPEGNALADYLSTLTQFSDLPEDTLVLPAHNQPFTGLHDRVTALREHHQHQLRCLYNACSTPVHVLDCLPVLYKRRLDDHHLHFAIAECLSHLNYLRFEGEVTRWLGEDGIYYYQQRQHGPAQPDDEFLSIDVVNG